MKFRGERIPHPDFRVQVFITKDGVEKPFSPERSQRLMNHNADGFDWGFIGSGPSQLALALLLEVTDNDEVALSYYHDFSRSVVSCLPLKRWTLTADAIRQWIGEWKVAMNLCTIL